MENEAERLGVSLYILAVGTNEKAREVVTGSEITGKYQAALGIRKVDKKTFKEYYTDEYLEKINIFISKANINLEKKDDDINSKKAKDIKIIKKTFKKK